MARKSIAPNAPDTTTTEPEMPETQGPHDPRVAMGVAMEAEAPAVEEAAPVVEAPKVEEPAPVATEPEVSPEPPATTDKPAPVVMPDIVMTEKPWSKVRVITATTVAWNGCMLKLGAGDVLEASGFGPGFIQALRDSGVPLENLS